MIQAVIFDMDGLMVDSEPLHYLAYQEVLKKFGISFTQEMNRALYIGVSERETSQDMVKRFALPISPQELVARKEKKYARFMKTQLRPQPGIQPLISALRNHPVKLGLASGSTRQTVLGVVKMLSIQKDILCIATSEDVAHGKPAPDIYLYVAQKLNVLPKNCLVLEDAPKGVEAAIRAGMLCFAIPSDETKDQDFSQATKKFSHLSEVYPFIRTRLLNQV